MLTWDEMDGDAFYMSRGQYSDAAHKTMQANATWVFEPGTHGFFRHSLLFRPAGFPCLSHSWKHSPTLSGH